MVLFLAALSVLGLVLTILSLILARSRESMVWKLLAFLSFCLFPVIVAGAVVRQDFHMMKRVDFCGGCHVMEPYVGSLTVDDDEPLSSVHYRNNYVSQETACYGCHTSYAMFGDVQAKINGLRHVWVFLTQAEVDSIALYEPYSNDNCLYCHGPAERFQRYKKHEKEKDFLERVQTGELSCLKSGCHDVGHYWETNDEEDEDW